MDHSTAWALLYPGTRCLAVGCCTVSFRLSGVAARKMTQGSLCCPRTQHEDWNSHMFRRRSPEARIDRFWRWWADNRVDILAAARQTAAGDYSALDTLLTPAVRRLGDVEWQFGPGDEKAWLLIISPGGLREILPLTVAWAEAAPDDPDVEFQPAKPARGGLETLMLPDGTTVDVDQLRYAVEHASDGLFDILVYHPIFRSMDEETRFAVTLLGLDAAFGEMTVMTRLGAIEPVPAEVPRMLNDAGLRAVLAGA